MLKDLLIIDIETVPIVESFNELSKEWQTLWWDKVSNSLPPNCTPEESWNRKAGILAEFGKIICISTAYFYENENRNQCLKIKSIYGHNEVDVLNQFILLCSKMYKHNKNFIYCGHNIKEFDIPYICRRLMINNLPIPEYLWLHDRKPWDVNMFDTLNWWKFGDNKNYISLHLLASVLNIPTSKSDIDGSKVQEVYYKEKNLQRIVEYCQKDVVVCANIVLKYKGIPLLSNESIFITN
ncbi:MAG TPA: ribonuclease H-like domain-containing protein [Chitinophagaceae bacterium]|nr:ribonuclease H-like domain-containing protein [Chitinophagaceae bacterium]MCC6635654.1 ribonuclease H-like domain-containing protein [Chitinophagaceae bacterium]HMZ45671.1 ribonuclease H-like domain-containing protein [Chitinophagaceae bacterium]HNE92872.1 ribonuclease H-like domain-containing protein [Chitinophagaceae bacterium]HNJ57674.1 ribonuclease H-like domain-containing protein [Chitinophagaceae bacterium]